MTGVAVDRLGARGVSEVLEQAAVSMRTDPRRKGCCVHLPDHGRLLVTGDLHDHPIHFQKVKEYAELDKPDHHVVFHELIHGDTLMHGVDLSWRMLAKVAILRMQHPEGVHPMLANHEIAQAFGQQVSKGAGENTRLFGDGLEWSFGDDAEMVDAAIGVFIRAMPLAIRSANGVFCSHSLPSPQTMAQFDLGILSRDLVDADFEAVVGSAWSMTWGRGQTEASVKALAKAWNVKLFIAGHKHVEDGVESPFPELLLINSDHEHGMVLVLDLSETAPTASDAVSRAVTLASIGECES